MSTAQLMSVDAPSVLDKNKDGDRDGNKAKDGDRDGNRDGGRDLGQLEIVLKALASERRLLILEWLKDPGANFPPQEHGDHDEHGACNLFIVEKLGVSQPAGSRHLKVLVDAGLITPTRRKGWTYYRRNEARIAEVLGHINQI